ncbi:MAG TPA: hypothetical protein VKV77_03555 [Methylovirgula sp.]|nr:hypothetical protein [Methylovirgula sp.]
MMNANSTSWDELVAAAQRVAQMKVIVAGYRERIAELKACGRPTFDEDQTLEVLLSSLELFEDYEKGIRAAV